MSTQGTATVVVDNEIARGAGKVIGVIGGMPVVILAGGSVLIVKGVMYCAEELKNYVEKIGKEAIDMYNAHVASNLKNEEKQSSDSTASRARVTAGPQNSEQGTSDVTQFLRGEQEHEIALVHNQCTDDDVQATNSLSRERDLLDDRLRADIEAGRGILSAGLLKEVEKALKGTPDTIQHALEQLERAWQQVTDAQAQRTRQMRQAQQLIRGAVAQLANIDSLLHKLGETKQSIYLQRKRVIEMRTREAEQQLMSNPAHALSLANDAQQQATSLVADVSHQLYEQWEELCSKQSVLQGILVALDQMVHEAITLKLVSTAEGGELKQHIQNAQGSIQRFLNAGMSSRARREAFLLNERVELLKKDVFQRVQTSQQKNIAQTIARTLAEEGFQGTRSEAPVLQTNGDTIRIVAKRTGHTPGFVRDDKHVAFDITRDGEVSYDFSGYVGDTCVEDAKNIFTALRKNGIYILDDEAVGRLQQVPSEHITSALLAQEEFQPQVTRKKAQAELVERLSRVLAQMNYQNIKKRSAGGTIEIDAFNGTIGYHIVLPSEGEVQVLKDAQYKDISHDSSDPIVVEASHGPEVEQTTEALKQGETHRSVQQRKQISH